MIKKLYSFKQDPNKDPSTGIWLELTREQTLELAAQLVDEVRDNQELKSGGLAKVKIYGTLKRVG